MSLTACSLLVAAALATGSTAESTALASLDAIALAPKAMFLATPEIAADQPRIGILTPSLPADSPSALSAGRPKALPAMYASLAALQAMDLYSTRRALKGGATEANPVMREAAGNTGAMLAVKAAATATSIFFTERAWKKNRKGAVILMAAINGVTAAIVANNLKNAK